MFTEVIYMENDEINQKQVATKIFPQVNPRDWSSSSRVDENRTKILGEILYLNIAAEKQVLILFIENVEYK